MISDFDKQQELGKLISKYTDLDGVHPTSIESLFLIRESTISEPVARVNEISFCIIVQGEKEVLLGEECFKYGPGNFIVASVELPVTGQVINASYDFPYLALKLEFTPKDILEVLDETGIRSGKRQDTKRAMFIGESEPSLLDAVIRLASLLDKQKHIPILAPLYKKEILYWVLQGPNGNALQQMAVVGSNAMRIRDVIEYIISDFEKSFRIEDLADIANMSVSSLHRHFKEVTAMSPIQFQKLLRLQEARRLLLAELPDIADVAFRVGYESQSQFTREYARMFGFSPRADIKRLREEN
ncbi:AraC family transcriptional regulator [Terribacillus saccharophilus]|uniref:AraC family transcriptional regulator n=1 Tax=Terribacillus saccharophilus TaxID=361277 RepID=UPI000BA78247|nr:AraC family transcriptional regulator [Terribacillus saccharophilus]PAF19783.1 AraC family transcriptional regulator [Terribacillus saccharophilus]